MAEAVQAQQQEGGDDVNVPDVELLTFQKQRSTPKVRLSEVNVDGTEEVHVEVDDFEQLEPNSPFIGLAKAGNDEEIIQQLHRAGSLGGSDESPAMRQAAQQAVQEEE